MGYDFYITENEKWIEDAYFSYNWGSYATICREHPGTKCDCKKERLWCARKDVGCRTGRTVRRNCIRALKLLKSIGIEPIEITDDDQRGWGHITVNGKQYMLPPRERLGIFAFHVRRFLELGKKYPRAVFEYYD